MYVVLAFTLQTSTYKKENLLYLGLDLDTPDQSSDQSKERLFNYLNFFTLVTNRSVL